MKFQTALISLLSTATFSGVHSANMPGSTGINVTEGVLARLLVDTLLADLPYIEVTGSTLIGNSACAGIFEGAKNVASMLFDKGIVLSTGDPSDLEFQDSDRATTMHQTPGDADLNGIVDGATSDACALEFSFECKHYPCYVSFNYVFGSDEYTEYVNNAIDPDDPTFAYNDVFGFFLNAENIALVPNTDTHVSIDTVNNVDNSAYFINNDPSELGPVPYPNMEADGFTTVLSAYGTAKEGSNTMKLVIADRVDGIIDSWALIQAKSFTANPPAGGAGGDPHFSRWGQPARDTFHGECDLVLVHAEDFHGGLDVHVRTTIESFFSYIEAAAVRIGEHNVEVNKGRIVVDGQEYADEDLPVKFGDYMIELKETEKNRRKYGLVLEENVELEFKFYKKYMTFGIEGHANFEHASGMLGQFPTGEMLDRQGKVVANFEDFGFEWQVNPAVDPTIFAVQRAPQMPYEVCRIPSVAQPSRRQLRSNKKLFDEAQEACGKVNGSDFDLCVNDVMMTGDIEMAHEW